MNLVVDLKLLPDKQQQKDLLSTLTLANQVCNYISAKAFESKTFRRYDIQKLCYFDIRKRFAITAQFAVRCIAKVAHGYVEKKRRKALQIFRKYAAQPYDARIFRFCKGGQAINIWTVVGRMEILFVCGERQKALLKLHRGEVDLIYRKQAQEFYLYCTIEIKEPEIIEPNGFIGVDLGVVNIAVDSTGRFFSGKAVEEKRSWYASRKAKLQPVGTKAVKRRLRKLSGRQSRFQSWTNHNISRHLVDKAKRNGCGIALENLKYIRKRIRAKKSQKARLHNWSFYQLRSYIEYKARLAGVSILLVDPRNTSRTCPQCRHCERANRKTQELFTCKVCGHSSNADLVGAINIARAAVNQPNVLESRVQA